MVRICGVIAGFYAAGIGTELGLIHGQGGDEPHPPHQVAVQQ